MKQLKAISDYLREKRLIDDDRFDSYAESGTLEPSGAPVVAGHTPVKIAYRTKYDAILSWEAFTADPYELFGEVMRWLEENDYDFDAYGMPTFDIDIVDNVSADVDISISFEEAVYATDGAFGDDLVIVDEPVPSVVTDIKVCVPRDSLRIIL